MFISLLLVCLVNMCDSIQSSGVRSIIVDAETGSRIVEAMVVVDDSITIVSDWEGSVTLPNSYTSLTISHEGYLKRFMNRDEVTDTIPMLNNGRCLNEVVVWGHAPRPQLNFSSRTRSYASAYGKKSFNDFDFFKTLDNVIHYKRNKRRKRAMKIISGY